MCIPTHRRYHGRQIGCDDIARAIEADVKVDSMTPASLDEVVLIWLCSARGLVPKVRALASLRRRSCAPLKPEPKVSCRPLFGKERQN